MQKKNKIKVYIATPNSSSLVHSDPQLRQKFIAYNFNRDHSQAIQTTSPDAADIIILFQSWSFKLPAYIDELCSDSFIREYAHKIYVINYDSTVREGFLPGCYVSLQKSHYDPERFSPCPYPKVYNEFIGDHLLNQPTQYLFSFRGTLHSHKVRSRMFNDVKRAKNALIIDNTKAFHSHTISEKETYLQELSQSQFILCPRGTSPNSYRLFETLRLGRCPVIISDEWVPPKGPQWSECSIRISESDTSKIESILNERQDEAPKLGANARETWESYFSEEKTYQGYLDTIMTFYNSSKHITKTFDEYKTYWRSSAFMYKNDWTLSQKIQRRLKFWA